MCAPGLHNRRPGRGGLNNFIWSAVPVALITVHGRSPGAVQPTRTEMRRGCPTGSCVRRVGRAVSVAVADDHVIRPIAVRCAFPRRRSERISWPLPMLVIALHDEPPPSAVFAHRCV